MPCSLAQVTQMSCPECSVDFVTELWLIIDTKERSDLYEELMEDSIHDVACPHCGHVGRVDAPLLVCHVVLPTVNRLNRSGPIYTKPVRRLFFFPPLNPSDISDEALAVSLLNVLRDRLGDEWNTFAKTKLLSVPRPLLAVAIADDPEAALARMRGKVAVQLAQIEAGDSPRERRQNQPTLH
ncbi:MAG: hypothetical protein KDD84_02195 [Caldilineaceae bacterium]|nr:hypothetical protein [Caldilineaceae bacterium]